MRAIRSDHEQGGSSMSTRKSLIAAGKPMMHAPRVRGALAVAVAFAALGARSAESAELIARL